MVSPLGIGTRERISSVQGMPESSSRPSNERKSVHKDGREMKTSLQARHTWVNAIVPPSLWRLPRKSGMVPRISGGTRLIGANPFFQDRSRVIISEMSCSRIST